MLTKCYLIGKEHALRYYMETNLTQLRALQDDGTAALCLDYPSCDCCKSSTFKCSIGFSYPNLQCYISN